MPEKIVRVPKFIYPEEGPFQVCCDQINGIWYTWTRIDGQDQTKYPHSSAEDAQEIHQGNIAFFRFQGEFE